MLGVLAILLGGAALYVYHQRGAQTHQGVPGLLRQGNADFENYKARIRIENVTAKLLISYNNSRTATITGTIINDSDRKLEALELHITLYDMGDLVSKERTAFALRPGAGFGWKPVEPSEHRSFIIGVESVDRNWNPEKIAYEITGLKYQ